MDANFQRDLNHRTGAALARTDVPLSTFNSCGQRSITHMRSNNMRRSLMGSIAMGNANPPQTKEAIYSVVSDHLYGRISDAQAVTRLQKAITDSAERQSLVEHAKVQTTQPVSALNSVH